MAIFKCKICGGALEIDSTQTVATCEYCGTKQTLPNLDDERRANLYDRANHFRRNNDFDKAMGIYESILNEDNTDAEAYWSIVLCRYGIEYVEDPATHKRIPTVNRAQFTSIFDDEDYKSAIANADGYQREIYESEATAINEIQKGILAISQKEEPFDVFICYKETDTNGRRTQDSVLATELYGELIREGFKVFFSRITLEDKLGAAYEPYIFAALHSAKVMVVIGTRPDHFNAVWVKNEWSRFLALIKNGEKKTLIPAYRDMEPYDLPEEFSHLQAQDMSKLGFMQDLVRGIRKIVEFDESKTKIIKETVITGPSMAIEPLFKRADMALADGEFGSADAFYEQILNQDPENADAYVGKLLAELQIKTKGALKNCEVSFEDSKNYKKAIQFANEELKKELSDSLKTVLTYIDDKKKEEIYQKAKFLLNSARDIPTCQKAQKLFSSISDYLDAEQCLAFCQEKINDFQIEWEQLRLDQRRKEEERKIAAKKTAKRMIIIGVCLLIVAIISVASYFYVSGVVIPDSQYEDALEMIEEQKYDDAISLLQKAKENALFDSTISKINEAIDEAEAAKEREKAAEEEKRKEEEAKKALEQSVANGISDIADANYEKAIRDLLKAGVSTRIVYQCEGGNLIGSESNEVIYASESEFSHMLTAERTGYRFVEWTCETYEYKESETLFCLVLKAAWSEKEYVIKYDLNGGAAMNVTEYGVEDEAFTLNAPTRTGYTFTGWTGTDLTQPTMTVTIPTGSHGDRTYTANWEANSYSVSFDMAGGNSAIPEATYTYDKSVTLPTPQRDAYTFAGWYNGTQKVSSGTWKTPNNVTLVAKWTPITYRVTYDLGKVPARNTNKTQFTVESNTITLSNLSYDYCTFEGWYSDSDFSNKVTEIPKGSWENITLYAKWDIQTFTIEYDWNGGDEASSAKKTYTVLDLPLSLSAPQKSGHSFYYWAQGELDGEPIKQITACDNYKLVANYIPDGLKIQVLNGVRGEWCSASYNGDATEIEIPKYHMLSYFKDSPYIQTVTLMTVPNLQSISFSDEIYEIDITDKFKFNVYENGNYVGSRNNPYHSLIGRADPNTSIKTIHRDTVYVGKNVFSGDMTLASIVIPEKIKYIDAAFEGCYNLVEVYDLSSLNIQLGSADHGGVAYYAEVVHTSHDEPSRVSQQGEYIVYSDAQNGLYKTFVYLGDDTEVVLPDNINGQDYELGDYLFYERAEIKSIVIPESVTAVGSHTFYGCSGITTISLPSKITHIGSNTFYECSNLESITIPQNLVAFGKYSFYNCSSLRSITLPATLTKIGTYTFGGCEMLLEVYNLSSLNLEKLGSESGYLTLYPKVIHASLDEPSCWTVQEDYVFFVSPDHDVYLLCEYVGSATELVLPSNINGHSYEIHKYAFYRCDRIASVTISEGVTGIDEGAFGDCKNLNFVYIGKDICYIGEDAFKGCLNLQEADFAVTEGWQLIHSGSVEKNYAPSEMENDSLAAIVLQDLNKIHNHLRRQENS